MNRQTEIFRLEWDETLNFSWRLQPLVRHNGRNYRKRGAAENMAKRLRRIERMSNIVMFHSDLNWEEIT